MSRAAVRTVRRAAAVRTNRSSMDAYTYGTAAREVAPSYEEVQRRERRLEQRRRVRTAKRRQQEAARMDLPYLMMFIVATVAALLICCSYIRVQSEIAGSIHQIYLLQLYPCAVRDRGKHSPDLCFRAGAGENAQRE